MKKLKTLFRTRTYLMIAISLAVVGVASAAVFNYISNSVVANTTVASPIHMDINSGRDGSATGQQSIGIATTGGGEFTFTTVAKNNAQNSVNGYNVMVVNETDGGKLTGEEIAELMFEDSSPFGPFNILPVIYVVEGDGSLTSLAAYIAANRSDKKLVLMADQDGNNDGAQLTTLAAGEARWNVYKITLAGGAVGTYDLYSQYVAEGSLAAYATDQYTP